MGLYTVNRLGSIREGLDRGRYHPCNTIRYSAFWRVLAACTFIQWFACFLGTGHSSVTLVREARQRRGSAQRQGRGRGAAAPSGRGAAGARQRPAAGARQGFRRACYIHISGQSYPQGRLRGGEGRHTFDTLVVVWSLWSCVFIAALHTVSRLCLTTHNTVIEI